MALLIAFIILAVVVSFLCSLLEAVILSVSHAYIAVGVEKKKKSIMLLEQLKDDVQRPLAAILTVNTIANTVGAAGVGAQVQILYGDEYLAVASGSLTFTILLFSEIIPKNLGASRWKKLAPACAYIIRFLIYLVYPLVLLSEKVAVLFHSETDQGVTREEMIKTAEMGVEEGTIRQKESSIIKNLLLLDNINVSEIMTPRSVIKAFRQGQTVEQIMKENKPIRFSRIPVYEDDLDSIVGMVHRYKLLDASSQDLHTLKVSELMTPIHSVPESISVAAALDQFIKRREHLFLVVDDYGSTAGIVTLEDAVETLLGVEIVDEFDSVADMRQHALELWQKRKSKQRAFS